LSEDRGDLSWFWGSDLCQNLRAMSYTEKPNLLTLLFAAHDEVRLHTPLLGWLLDPKGDHGLGKEPLSRFLSMLEIDGAGADHAQVWRERSFPGHGRVDLMIRLPGCCLVIENKLYAADQEAQLWRYQQVLVAEVVPPVTSHLFYLTLDGCEPSPISVSAPSGSGDIPGLEAGSYQCISYETEIHSWLTGLLEWTCAKQKTGRIQHILTQYNEVLMEAIGMHSREEALSELNSSGLMDHVAANQGDVTTLAKLIRSVFFLHARLLEELIEGVHEALEKEPRLERVKSPERWSELDWGIYEGWARGRTPSGYRFYRMHGVRDRKLENLHLVVGLDASDRFWVGLGRFEEGKHAEVPADHNRFVDIEGATHNNWWLSWVTIQEVDPAQFDGDIGVGRLAKPEVKTAIINRIKDIFRHYVREIG